MRNVLVKVLAPLFTKKNTALKFLGKIHGFFQVQ